MMLLALLTAGLFSTPLPAPAQTSRQKGPEKPAPRTREATPPLSADELYLQGVKAFYKGDDENAAALIIKAAQADWRCAALFADLRYQRWIPPTPCSEILSLKPTELPGSTGGFVLYRLALIRRNPLRPHKLETDPLSRGHYFLEKILEDYPDSSFADDAALLLREDGRCKLDPGYPECPAWTIRNYEEWLEQYPRSDRREEVLEKTARAWLKLAERYETPAAWRSEVKAELCRGKALSLAEQALANREPGSAPRWALAMIKEIKESGKPYSLPPGNRPSAPP